MTTLMLACPPILHAAATDAGAEVTIEKESGPDSSKTIEINGDNGPLSVETRAARLSVKAGKKNVEWVILAFREPKTGVSMWETKRISSTESDYKADQIESMLRDWKLIFAGNRFVAFRLLGKTLYIREGSEKQQDLDGVIQHAITAMKSRSKDVYEDPIKERKQMNLAKALGLDFFSGSKPVAQYRPSKLVDVAKTGSGWTVTLQGPDGEQGVVVLGDDFVVKSAKQGDVK